MPSRWPGGQDLPGRSGSEAELWLYQRHQCVGDVQHLGPRASCVGEPEGWVRALFSKYGPAHLDWSPLLMCSLTQRLFVGLVNTNVFTIQGLGAIPQFFIDWVFKPLLTPMMVSIDETGERGMFHATSDRYPAANASNKGDQVARGTTGEIGSGAYALNWNGEPSNSEKVLGPMRKEGIPRKIWEHTISEFERIGRL